MVQFQQKYRVESARLPHWDYAGPGWYYVTICTRDRLCHFGNVMDDRVDLSPIGRIVADEWRKTAEIRAAVALDEWVLMPNHLHGILVIHAAPTVETPRRGVSTVPPSTKGETAQRAVSTANSLGSIVGQFKGACTKRVFAAGLGDFAWQPRYYDHVIRNYNDLTRIREYIVANPLRWELDRDRPANLDM
ncbi:MAG: transposase [Deltaproteobacteria bacterium]|nr:transposase [Deltaproteobacteria bacterium]